MSFFSYDIHYCWPAPIIVGYTHHLKPAAVALQQITLCMDVVHSHGTPQLSANRSLRFRAMELHNLAIFWQPPKKWESLILLEKLSITFLCF